MSAMLVTYALEARSRWFILAFAGACLLGSSYGFLRLDLAGLMAEAVLPWSGAPDSTRVGHIHLRVGEIARATAFYAGILGLDVTRGGPEARFLSSGGYHHHVAVNIWRSPGAGPRDPARAGLGCVTMAAADRSVANAIAQRGHADDLAGAGLRDPWGTQIKIIIQPEGPPT